LKKTHCATTRTLDGAEPDEDGCLSRRVRQKRRICVLGSTIVKDSKGAVSSGATSMNDAFRDALVIETVDLFTSDLVLKQSGTGVLSVRHFQPRRQQ